MKHIKLIVFALLLVQLTGTFTDIPAQKVAITIDDVPNTRIYKESNFQSLLLQKFDSLEIPITIFINESLIYRSGATVKNFELLHQWAQMPWLDLGNHSLSHARYSVVGIDSFTYEIIKGEGISRELANLHNKELKYFRFPYNDLGKDSLQQVLVREYLRNQGYTIAPFTIESSDWMFNYVYEHYLNENKPDKAKAIVDLYLEKTLAFFDFYDSLSQQEYGRQVKQIYLCHDNKLNADYLDVLVSRLAAKGYQFISMEAAMQDEVYQQSNNYYQKWGISWFYRWMPTQPARVKWMRREPDMQEVIDLYNKLTKANQ